MRGRGSREGRGEAFNRRGRGGMPQRSLRGMRGVIVWAACVFFASQALAQVTFERLVNSAKEPQNWMTYSGDYSGKRFSGLDQINVTNARTMVAKWVYQTGATGKLETTPLVVDGILYATAQDDRAFALDARTRAAHLDVPAADSRGHSSVLRTGESRAGDSGRQSFSGHAGCARGRARCEDRKRGVGRGRGGLSHRAQLHGGAAGGEGSGRDRHFRRRVRSARVH